MTRFCRNLHQARSKLEKNGKPNIFTIIGRYKTKGHKQDSQNRPRSH